MTRFDLLFLSDQVRLLLGSTRNNYAVSLHVMADLARRSFLNSIAMAGAAGLLPLEFAKPAFAAAKGGRLSPKERKTLSEPLVAYFKVTAPKLLRPAQGPLKHPSIAPSLPGKQYSAELWDW